VQTPGWKEEKARSIKKKKNAERRRRRTTLPSERNYDGQRGVKITANTGKTGGKGSEKGGKPSTQSGPVNATLSGDLTEGGKKKEVHRAQKDVGRYWEQTKCRRVNNKISGGAIN